MSTAMESSWLMQRLHRPMGGGLIGRDNPFAFGGGMKNGGLSDEAMDLLRSVFSFDYMGAAEFEWGAVPEALDRLAKSKRLTAWSFSIPLAAVEKRWDDKSNAAPAGEATVYVICDHSHAGEVEDRIRRWAAKDHTMKESTHLPRTLRPVDEWDDRTCGWLELDNGFFFFTDQSMWKATADLFGVMADEVVA